MHSHTQIQKRSCVFVAPAFFLFLVYCFYCIALSNFQFLLTDFRGSFKPELQQKVESNATKLQQDSSKILILIWPNDAVNWDETKAALKSNDSRCKFTADKKLVNEADVLVHYVIYAPEKLPNIDNRNQSQLRIFFMAEPPTLYNFAASSWSHFSRLFSSPPQPFTRNSYHWTFTYRRDSDIVASYGSFKPLKNTPPFSPLEIQRMKNHSMEIPKEKLETYKNSYLKGKSKLVAWVVSHCSTQSKREKLVAKLSKFLKVDVYGKCKGLKCPRDSKTLKKSDCYESLGPQYKFYLSFENSLCLDYVTEKLFKALKNHMVPIVYGVIGSEYEKVAPPGSYINVRDFSSTEKLAEYIKFLDENPDEYLKYFLWKEKYWIFTGFPWWDICQRVWAVSMVNQEGKRSILRNYTNCESVKDVSSWWFKGNSREEKGDELLCKRAPKYI